MLDWIVITDDKDCPEDDYDTTHKLYLCITESGKTLVCKYKKFYLNQCRWENASNWRDNIGTVVAYKEIHIPEHILNLCVGSGVGNKHVEYFDGLK